MCGDVKIHSVLTLRLFLRYGYNAVYRATSDSPATSTMPPIRCKLPVTKTWREMPEFE
jgi:hypothetical protein